MGEINLLRRQQGSLHPFPWIGKGQACVGKGALGECIGEKPRRPIHLSTNRWARASRDDEARGQDHTVATHPPTHLTHLWNRPGGAVEVQGDISGKVAAIFVGADIIVDWWKIYLNARKHLHISSLK